MIRAYCVKLSPPIICFSFGTGPKLRLQLVGSSVKTETLNLMNVLMSVSARRGSDLSNLRRRASIVNEAAAQLLSVVRRLFASSQQNNRYQHCFQRGSETKPSFHANMFLCSVVVGLGSASESRHIYSHSKHAEQERVTLVKRRVM